MFFKTKKKEKQKTFIYCPKCNTELIKNGLFIKDEDGVLEYGCPKCGTTSFWDFSFPTPYLRTCKDCMHIHDNDFGSPYCEKEVNKKCSPNTQKMFDVRGCEYCDTELPFAYGRTNSQGISIQYPNELTAYAYDKNIATVKIKYCPMCGKKLKEG